jgi:hypothetical protein
VISGIFFGSSSPVQAAPAITSANSATFTIGSPGTFTVIATGIPTPTLSESGALPNGVAFNTSTGALNGTPAAGSNPSYSITFAATNGVSPDATQTFTLLVNPGASAGPAATFVGSDITTQGNWPSKYGSDGYAIANSGQSLPGYVSFAPQNALLYTWTANTTDVRALKIPGGSANIASTWYNNPGFSLDVNITDGGTHQVALYAVDWDSGGTRSATIQVLDANNTHTVLDTRTLTGYQNGAYLVWLISGHVIINVTRTAGDNAVISGIFFDHGAFPSGTILRDSVNWNLTAGSAYWGSTDTGWMFTPSATYQLIGVATQFGVGCQTSTCPTTASVVIESSPGGTVLASASFTPVPGGISVATFTPITLTAGTPYFVGFEHIQHLSVNATFATGATLATSYSDSDGSGSFNLSEPPVAGQTPGPIFGFLSSN